MYYLMHDKMKMTAELSACNIVARTESSQGFALIF